MLAKILGKCLVGSKVGKKVGKSSSHGDFRFSDVAEALPRGALQNLGGKCFLFVCVTRAVFYSKLIYKCMLYLANYVAARSFSAAA